MNTSPAAEDLAVRLALAYRSNSVAIVPPSLEPSSEDDAYAAQLRMLENCGARIGGWKIGAKSADGPIQGAPLPQAKLLASPCSIARRDFPILGVELEVAFTFEQNFLPQGDALSDAAILDSISGACASIEIVSSRVAGWPETAKLIQLADLQNHGALVVGEMVDYRDDFPYAAPQLQLDFNGTPLFAGIGRNPAGDPRRLLVWLLRHCRELGLTLRADSIITTGSYTGVEFPHQAGTVTGTIAGLPPVSVELT